MADRLFCLRLRLLLYLPFSLNPLVCQFGIERAELPRVSSPFYLCVLHENSLYRFIISGEFTDLPIAAVNNRFISEIALTIDYGDPLFAYLRNAFRYVIDDSDKLFNFFTPHRSR